MDKPRFSNRGFFHQYLYSPTPSFLEMLEVRITGLGGSLRWGMGGGRKLIIY